MTKKIKDLLPFNLKDYDYEKIDNEASLRKYYRLYKNDKSFIFMDSSKEPSSFINFLKIHRILSKINISIPKIHEVDKEIKVLLMEDFGKLRFDKINNQYGIKDLLSVAVDSLIILNKEINFDSNYNLSTYNYNIFKNEISEFIDFFYPYIYKKTISLDQREEFFEKWKKQYDSIYLDFTSFVHKDYNFNNLFYLPSRKLHNKCGIIDFQNAFWGEDCWDLFSLLEDSRQYFDDQHNDFYISYFYSNSKKINSIQIFKEKYCFFNCSRQTRLLGRWVKLSKELNQKFYLDFIDVTKKRLIKSLQVPFMEQIKNYYYKLIPDFYDS